MTTDTTSIRRLTSVTSEHEASAIVGALADRGITAHFVGGYTAGFRAEAPGEVQVLVREDDLARAKQVVKEFGDSAADIDWSKVDCGEAEMYSDDRKLETPNEDRESRPLQFSLMTLLIAQSLVCVLLGITHGANGAALLAGLFVVAMYVAVVLGTIEIVSNSGRTLDRIRFLAPSLVNVGFVFLVVQLLWLLFGN